MTYREPLSECTIAISASESPDMPALGLSHEHLRDAMTEIARHLLALGARLVYGGDLRALGFTQLLFELVARHRRDADEGDERTGVVNYLAWPVHVSLTTDELNQFSADLAGAAELICLGIEGRRLGSTERQKMAQRQPTEKEWTDGLTAMRHVMRRDTHARIVLGGRVDKYKGAMPGIAEEALLSLEAGQPLFIIGGFGGCARDIAEALGLVSPRGISHSSWRGRQKFDRFGAADLNNCLTAYENTILANTSHIDQAVAVVLGGLLRVANNCRGG